MKGGLLKSTSSAGRPRQRQSNIRGRISGPIPIPDPAEDDEFPMRGETGTPALVTPVTSEPPPPPAASQQQPPQERNSTAADAQSTNGHIFATPVERTETRSQAGTARTAHTAHALDNSGSIGKQRTARSSNVRYSTASNAEDGERDTAPQRKKSTLRTAFSKLFGRKKKGSGDGAMLETHFEDPASSKQHQSDPTSYGRSLPMEGGDPKRSVSLPVTEFDRALRSHSLGPDDMMAIESARNSIQVDPMRFRRRAATTSSRIYDTRSRDFGDLHGLTPRPASAHGRSSLEAAGDDSPENIGRAITSDILTLHRRSRSLSQLYETAAAGGKVPRKRSDEIRYWRESYDPGFHSPTSSNMNMADDTGVLHQNGDAIGPEPPAGSKPKTPPQPFNFGPIAGMKITQAASLEERMAAMETHNQKLERLVTQLFQLISGTNAYPDSPERGQAAAPIDPSLSNAAHGNYRNAPADPRASSHYSTSRHSNESFGDGVTFVGSVPTSFGPGNRPTSMATVRGATSLPTLPRLLSGPFTTDHYATLLALIETERSARQALEAQVNKLTTQLHLVSRRSERFDGVGPTPLQSAFEIDEDDELQATPVTESGSEAFRTPREERSQYGFGAFGEELRDEGSEGKRAARTLSLSQLTLKKPPKTRPQEVGVNL